MARLVRAWVSSRRATMFALLHVIAVLDPEVADDAAGRMLHLLHVGIDDELAPARSRAPEISVSVAQPKTMAPTTATAAMPTRRCRFSD